MKKLMLVLFIILISSTFAAADLLDGLVLSMSFDEGTGKEAMDGSANGFAGTVNGNAQWVEGKFGMALEFNASADHVAIADNDAFHIEDEITQAAWVKLNRLPGAHAVIFGTRAGGGARHIGFGYGMNPQNGIKVWTNGANGGFKDINDTVTQLEVDKWYYVSYTHTTENSGKVKIYVDGVVSSEQRPLPTAQLDEKSLDDLLQDISGLSEESPKENPLHSAASRKKEDDFHSDFEDDAVGNEFEDLNLAPDEVVKQKKKEMDVLFESNRIRPGDEGWQYDKEVDFGGSDVEGKLSCGWDNESGEDSDLVF